MNSDVCFVDYRESISVKITKFILSKGFSPASPAGVIFRDDISLLSGKEKCIGLLYKDPNAKPRSYFFGLFKKRSRLRFLGVVRFDNDKDIHNWIFEMRGSEYIDLVKKLSEEMAYTFNVKIKLFLISEETSFEQSFDEYLYP